MSKIIHQGNMVLWKDARGRWQCRVVETGGQQMVRKGGAGIEAIRARLWGRRRRRDADDITPVVGNCGRPADQECGMLEPQQCAIHRQEPAPDGLEETKLHRLIVRAKRAALNAATTPPANATRGEQLAYVRRLRERHGLAKLDPRIVTADCQFRMRRW